MNKIQRKFDLSLLAQRMRLLKRLKKGPCSTMAARHELDILGVAQRILELRRKGYDILTFWSKEPNPGGGMHRVAQYVLMSEENKGGACES